MGPAQSQGRAEPQLQTLTQKTCLKEPATVPRCPLGQPAWPQRLHHLSPSPSPTPPPQGAGRQAPYLAELLTYSARWLCTACPGPSPEPRVGAGGHHLGTHHCRQQQPRDPSLSNPTASPSLV